MRLQSIFQSAWLPQNPCLMHRSQNTPAQAAAPAPLSANAHTPSSAATLPTRTAVTRSAWSASVRSA